MSGVKRLLEKMRRTKAGWTFADLERLYIGLWFEIREGGNIVYIFILSFLN